MLIRQRTYYATNKNNLIQRKPQNAIKSFTRIIWIFSVSFIKLIWYDMAYGNGVVTSIFNKDTFKKKTRHEIITT